MQLFSLKLLMIHYKFYFLLDNQGLARSQRVNVVVVFIIVVVVVVVVFVVVVVVVFFFFLFVVVIKKKSMDRM